MHGAIAEKARKRGYTSRRKLLIDLIPLSPALSLWERGLIGRMAGRSGFQP